MRTDRLLLALVNTIMLTIEFLTRGRACCRTVASMHQLSSVCYYQNFDCRSQGILHPVRRPYMHIIRRTERESLHDGVLGGFTPASSETLAPTTCSHGYPNAPPERTPGSWSLPIRKVTMRQGLGFTISNFGLIINYVMLCTMRLPKAFFARTVMTATTRARIPRPPPSSSLPSAQTSGTTASTTALACRAGAAAKVLRWQRQPIHRLRCGRRGRVLFRPRGSADCLSDEPRDYGKETISWQLKDLNYTQQEPGFEGSAVGDRVLVIIIEPKVWAKVKKPTLKQPGLGLPMHSPTPNHPSELASE